MRPKVLTTVSSIRPAGIRRHILADRYKFSEGPASSIFRVETTYQNKRRHIPHNYSCSTELAIYIT